MPDSPSASRSRQAAASEAAAKAVELRAGAERQLASSKRSHSSVADVCFPAIQADIHGRAGCSTCSLVTHLLMAQMPISISDMSSETTSPRVKFYPATPSRCPSALNLHLSAVFGKRCWLSFRDTEECCWLSFHHGCVGFDHKLQVWIGTPAVSRLWLFCFAYQPGDRMTGSKLRST